MKLQEITHAKKKRKKKKQFFPNRSGNLVKT